LSGVNGNVQVWGVNTGVSQVLA